MTIIQELEQAIIWELETIKHLYTKISPDKYDMKPGENMRTVKELLQYLTWVASASAIVFIKGNNNTRTGNMYRDFMEDAAKVDPADFIAEMDNQINLVKEAFTHLKEEDLKRDAMMPWGEMKPVQHGLINVTLKHVTAYKMQLFLYAKIAGAKEISTYNCWLGTDPPLEVNED
jgi:hypothetical protein